MPELSPPTAQVHDSFVAAMAEFRAEGRGAVGDHSMIGDELRGCATSRGRTHLGRIAIRHRLTPGLRVIGGHIGYDVRASARRRGYATAMLRAALPVARRHPALLAAHVLTAGRVATL